jgi:hypothetical protein
MLECEAHHYPRRGRDPPPGGGGPNSSRFTLRRPVMVDPIAKGTDIKIPLVTVGKAERITRISSGRRRTGLGTLVNFLATR